MLCSALPLASADMRSSVFAAVVARSGVASDCSAFANLFTADALYESPVGAGAVRGPTAIVTECEAWNKLVNPATGNGCVRERRQPRDGLHRQLPHLTTATCVCRWYPGPLFSSDNRTSFALQVRTVSLGGECALLDAASDRHAPSFDPLHFRLFTLMADLTTGCRVDIQGIVTVDFDTAAGKMSSWQHYYDAVWVASDLYGTCKTA
jgi:hypothetical protein